MFDDTLPSDDGAVAELRFEFRHGASRLAHLHQKAPLRVLFPDAPDGEIPTAALVNTGGGLVGGDHLSVRAEAGPWARGLVVAQAAEKAYRSAGPDCVLDVALRAETGAWLEWLPQETIIFQGARLRRTTRVEVAPGARLLAGEILTFGRRARGESLTEGLVRDAWEVRRDGRLIWADALYLDGDLAEVLGHAACFAGATACATALYVTDDAGERLDLARSLLEADGDVVRAAATVANGVLVVRWLAVDTAPLRASFAAFWTRFRAEAGDLPARLPRLWYV